jgi:O-acetyl-ADP-ribose deacetylase (regulator of RNase III)
MTPRLQLQLGDITSMEVDALVNSTDTTLLDGGPVHKAVHEAAGQALAKACEKMEGCEPGEVCLTPGYQLRAHSIIHTVAPTWMSGGPSEQETLASCYTKALRLAKKQGFRTLAFPSLGSGRQPQIPLESAAPIAIRSILTFLEANPVPEKVFLVCFDTTTYQAYQKVLREALP